MEVFIKNTVNYNMCCAIHIIYNKDNIKTNVDFGDNILLLQLFLSSQKEDVVSFLWQARNLIATEFEALQGVFLVDSGWLRHTRGICSMTRGLMQISHFATACERALLEKYLRTR